MKHPTTVLVVEGHRPSVEPVIARYIRTPLRLEGRSWVGEYTRDVHGERVSLELGEEMLKK